MMGAKRYYNESLFDECFQRLEGLRDSGETCDIRLLASKKEILAHKLVLATVSDYFKNAIYGLLLNKTDKTVLELKEVKYEIMCQIVNYMYSGTIEIDSENVYDLYHAADYYLINFLKDMCFDFWLENIDKENCVKLWLIANNCKHEELGTKTRDFIFLNLEYISSTKDFLSLSNEKILELFKVWPKNEISDSIVKSLLKWADDKKNWHKTVMNILKDIPHSSISEDYLDNVLSNNELIQNNNVSNKWMVNIYKEKLKSYKSDLTDALAEIKDCTCTLDQQILFVTHDIDFHNNYFYKYNINDGALNFFHEIRNHFRSDYEIYKNWIFVVGPVCARIPIDDQNPVSHEWVFRTNHDHNLSSAILNESLYIFGGNGTNLKGSVIDLNTNQTKSFTLPAPCANSGVAEHEGSIYICGGLHTDSITRFDSREGRATIFGTIPNIGGYAWFRSAAILSNQLYCSGYEQWIETVDLRNRNLWSEIKTPQSGHTDCLVSCDGTLYSNSGTTIYEYDNLLENNYWKALESFQELNVISKAISI